MNVVDSSAWLEYFGDGPNAAIFAEAIESPGELAVPTLTLFEVFKRTRQLTRMRPRHSKLLPSCYRDESSSSRRLWRLKRRGSHLILVLRWLTRSSLPPPVRRTLCW